MKRENVRISKKGWQLLNNPVLANKVSLAIANNKEKLETEGQLKIEGTNINIKLVTHFPDNESL